MERDGIAIDTDYLDELQSTFAAEAGSRRQGRLCRDRPRGEPRLAEAVAGGAVRRAEHAEDQAHQDRLHHRRRRAGRLHEQTGHPFLTHLLRHRDVTKLKTTVEGLRKSVGDDGRIHTTYQQTVAATGRLSSTEPNLQNIPIRTDEGRQIRRAFIAGPGYDGSDHRGLLADRDADHGASVRGRGPDRGVQLRRGPAHLRRDAGVRSAARAGHRRSCAAGSRRCPTAWPTGCRRSDCPAS